MRETPPFRQLLLAVTLAAAADPSLVWAQQAAGSGDHCTGTLCDFYYRNAAPAPSGTAPSAPPANGPTPLALPGVGALGKLFSGGGDAQPAAPGAAPQPMVQVQGGGLLGKVTGAPQPERCSGTLCDFYYGGPAPEPVEQPAQQAAAPAEPTPEPAAEDTAPARPRRRAVEVEEKPSCVSPANDPWRCYRK